MRLLHTLLLCCGLACLSQAQNYTITEVPNPKTTANLWVSDPNDYLSAEVEQILNDKIDAIERQTTAEVALVVLPDISAGTPHDFAVKLFNQWGVGKASENNGLLILMVMNQRRVEFVTGYGMEAILPDLRCYQIQQESMVPKFKYEQYGKGLIAGVDAVAIELLGDRWYTQPSSAEREYIGDLLEKVGSAPSNDQYLWGLDSLLSDSIYAQLNTQASQLQDSFGFKVFCIALNPSTKMSPAKVLKAIEVEWKLEQNEEVKNYVLLYYDLQRASIVVGYNTPDLLNYFDRETADYLQIQMKEQAANLGVSFKYGLRRLLVNLKTNDLRDEAHRYFDEIRKAKAEDDRAMLERLAKERRSARIRFILIILSYYLGAMAVLILAFLIFWGIAEKTVKNPYQKYHLLSFFVFTIWIILFPIPYIWIREFAVRRREAYRKADRNSKKNGKPMRMMTEEEEDRYLKSGQITEERINSIHYDVWITEDESDILVLPYKTIFSKFRNCIKCGWKTYYMVYNRTIRSATTSSSGLGEKKYLCKHCNHVHSYTYVIPQKSDSSSSSSAGGGSFGGGSSGGGGAGSSW